MTLFLDFFLNNEQNCRITDVSKKTDKLLVLLSCSLYLSDFILHSLWGFNNIFFDYERSISKYQNTPSKRFDSK